MSPLPVNAARLWQLLYQALDQSDDIVMLVQQVADEADSPIVVAVNHAFQRATGYSDGEALTKAMEKRVSLRTELSCISRTELLDGSNQPVLVTVGFDIFNTRARIDRYIQACQKLDPRLRRRLILTRLPDGIPKSRVLECITRLRPFCRGVGFAINDLEAPPVDLSNAGVPIVIVSAERLHSADGSAKARLAKLIGALHAHRARLFVRHVAYWERATSLTSTGVDLVSLAAA